MENDNSSSAGTERSSPSGTSESEALLVKDQLPADLCRGQPHFNRVTPPRIYHIVSSESQDDSRPPSAASATSILQGNNSTFFVMEIDPTEELRGGFAALNINLANLQKQIGELDSKISFNFTTLQQQIEKLDRKISLMLQPSEVPLDEKDWRYAPPGSTI